MASLPSGPTVLPSTSLAVRHSPPGITVLISGMMMSAASDDTTLPTAPPTMTATAKASTLFFSRNSLKPLIMYVLLELSVRPQELRQPFHGRFQYTSFRRVDKTERA